MSVLSLAMRNEAVKHPAIASLLGSNSVWDVWAFDQKPEVPIENSQKALIVFVPHGIGVPVSEGTYFKTQTVDIDIWADSTRNPDGTVQVEDADDKIEAITDALNKVFHTVSLSELSPEGLPNGNIRRWGSEQDIANRTAKVILGSTHTSSTKPRDMTDSDGTRMTTLTYAVLYA